MYFMEWAEDTKGLRKVILAAVVLMPVSAWAVNCSKARTSTEKAVCHNPKLKKLDKQMDRDYGDTINHYSASGEHDCYVESQEEEQKAWIKRQDACGADVHCIEFEYQDRLNLLQALASNCPGYDHDPAFKGRKCYEPAPCTPGDRVTYSFIKQQEGDMFEAYIPGAYKANTGTGLNEGPMMCEQKDKNGKVIKDKQGKVILEQCPAVQNSGITIGQGVDLGQQSESGLRRYMEIEEKKYGKPTKVGIEDILSEIPGNFYGIHKGKAVQALNGYYEANNHRYLKLSADESHFLSSAVQHGYAEDSAAMFKKNSKLDFWSLPAAVQTTFTDMKYNSVILGIPTYYYKGQWEQAAVAWEKMGHDPKYPKWKRDRFLKRSDMLNAAIKEGALPKSGDPCAPKKQGVAFNEPLLWRTQRLFFWA